MIKMGVRGGRREKDKNGGRREKDKNGSKRR